MSPIKAPARPTVVNWTAWGSFAAALMPMAQVSPPLRLFAVIALFFGGMFFLYALKYYVSMALILVANGNGNGNNGNGVLNGNGNGHGLRSLARNGEHHDKLPHKPFISIHLPLYNEASVVDRLLQSCTNLNYENYEVVVADDSSDETIAILDQRWAPHPRVKISRRKDRSGFKGGALVKALEVTDPQAEFIAVFDADFIPPPDILQQFLAYFYGINGNGNGEEEADYPQLVDDRLAVVQGYQWHILNASENWITRGIRTEFSGSYVIERSSQELLGAMKMISGSVFMIRADVLRQHGWGTSITEDWELTLRLYLSGYKVLYTPFIQAPSECVATFKQLARQRMRWAEGHTFNVKKYFLSILSSPNIGLTEKLEFIYYAPYYLQSVFFMIGTSCWLISEVVLQQRLPMLPATIGWALVFTNALSLVLMNLTGLFMERGVRRNWSGLLSFVLLTYLLVPYQAYAALKGLLEPHEGGWHRTQKTGIITDVVDKLGLGKRMKKLLPKQRKKKHGGVDLSKRLGLAQVANRIPQPIRRRVRRFSLGMRVASGLAALLLLLAVLAGSISVVSAAPDAFYLHPDPRNDGEEMTNTVGSGASTYSFDSIGQTARWYTELEYPAGGEDSVLDAGNYTFNLYFDQLPGGGWWDSAYAFRQQITVSTGSEAVGAGYSAALVFDHAALVAAGKAEASGDDLRVLHFDGSTWTELDRVVDPYANWDWVDTQIWFALQDPIPANDFDDGYYIYYGNPPAASPPDDPAQVFDVADGFDDGTISLDLAVSVAGNGTVVEDVDFNEVIIDVPADTDAGILVAESALAFSRQVAIRHITKLESANFESTLFGIVEDDFEPTVVNSASENARRRIMVTHDGGTEQVFVFYIDPSDTPWYWDGVQWDTTVASYDVWLVNEYHSIEFRSDGTDWWFEFKDEFGGFLASTDPVGWTAVQSNGDDLWFYWGEPYDDQYAAFQSSNWVDLRDFVDPEPATSLSAEQAAPSADITISVHHTDSDGSNPTLITSQSATIDTDTTNPFVLDLGAAPELTFNAANPQRLRVEIRVDDLTDSGEFVMAYDSSDDPTRLETPSLTVLDVGLILTLAAIFVPIITALATERRRMATRLISVIISIMIALALLSTQVAPVVAAPDVFYLHDQSTDSDPAWYDTNWAFRKLLTVDAAQVPADQSDFVVLVSLSSDAELAASAQDAPTAGYDILFTDSTGTAKLSHEIEKFDDSTGELVAWVELGSLSSTADTEFYLYYGNPAAANQQELAGTWSNGYESVYHLHDDFVDSSANQAAATNNGSTDITAGLAGDAQAFNGSSDYIDTNWTSNYGSNQDFTWSGWFRVSTVTSSDDILGIEDRGGGDNSEIRLSVRDDVAPSGEPDSYDVWIRPDGSGAYSATVPITSPDDGNWHYATLQRDGSTARLYYDGAQVDSGAVGTGGINFPVTLLIGAQWHTDDVDQRNYFEGDLDEIRTATVARSADWIQTEYSNLSSPSTFFKPLGAQENAPPSPAGKYLDTIVGDSPATLLFDTAGQNAYWYTDVSYPSGQDDASLAAGDYTFNMYFSQLPATWYDSAWSSRKLLTIDSAQVAADLNNYPVLVSFTDSDLIGNVQADGGDILFTRSDGTTKLDHEIEKVDSATGQLVAWVELDSVSSSVDTSFYLYFDNPGASDQWNIAGTWDNNYLGVWHLGESANGTRDEFSDSTANNNHGTGGKGYSNYVPAQAGAKIGDGQTFDGVNDFIDLASSGWYDSNWPYRKRIVIDGDLISGTGSHSYFPVLISVGANSDNDLKHAGSGGHVGKSDGTDIFFTNDEGGKLDHELELYDPATGELLAWVEVPVLSTTEDTTLYLYYGYASATDQQNVSGAWDENGAGNFRGVWHVDEDPTGTAPQFADSTANSNDGTAQPVGQEPTQTAGQFDNAVGFDDTNERHVEVADHASIQLGTNITVSAWVQTTDDETDVGLIANKWGSVAADRNYWLGKLNDASIAFYVDGAENVTAGLNLINDGSWHYVVGVADAANSLLRLFVDGTQRNTAAYDGTSATGTSDFYIGSGSGEIQQEFEGSIDEVRVAGAARTADWIATEWANQNSPSTFYQFLTEEQPGDIQLDLTGTAVTLQAWVKYDAAASDHLGILSKNGFSDGYRLVVSDPGHDVSFELTSSGGGDLDTTGTLSSDPDWHHVVATYDGSTMRVYINGAADATTTSYSDNLDRAGKEFWIGHGDHAIERAWSYPWFGELDEVRVSDIARPAEWILTEYNNHENQGTGPGAFLKTLGTLESAPSVQVVVRVHHTKPDGSDAQEIVSSSAVTIDSNTPNPFALTVGNDPSGQTFTSADPRLVRLQVEVAAINGGGSFTLAYDSSSDPTNLETPVLTVPDFSLVFAVLAALIPIVTFILTNQRRRRIAARLLSVGVSLLLALSLLSQEVITAVAAPDVFYLHESSTPAGSVSYVETQTTVQTIADSYSLPSVAGGTDRLYLVAVAIYGTGITVSSIDGGGLTWTEQITQCSARINQPRVSIWQAFGSPSSFSATVNLSGAPDLSSAAISSYSGADSSAPTEGAAGSNTNGQNGACDGSGVDNDTPSLSLTSSRADSVLFVATHPRQRTISTSDPDYTERAFMNNVNGGQGANLYLHDRTLATAGTDSADFVLNGTTDWDMAGLVINPGGGVSPAGQTMNNTAGSGAATLTFDTGGQDAYWYTDLSYPTGADDATIASGDYALNMYFSSLPDASTWWDTNYSYRQNLTITTAGASVPAGYSVSITLDHAQLVLDGKSQADGDDLRVTWWNGSTWVELDRFLDPGSAWNDASTRIWFQSQASITDPGSDSDYDLYYGSSGATNPPADPDNIFLFFDGFESGDTTAWDASVTSSGDTVGATTATVHTGSYAGQVDIDGSNPGQAALRDEFAATQGFASTMWVHFPSGYSFNADTTVNQFYGGVWGEQQLGLTVQDTTQEVFIWNNAAGEGYFGPSAPVINTGEWVRLEMNVLVSDTAGRAELWVNGVREINESNRNTGSVNTDNNLAGIFWKNSGPNTVFFDDVFNRIWVDGEPTVSPAAEVEQPSVDVTVSVYHTAEDGSDAQAIVTSSSTKITGATADPLTLAIGAGSEQTFTAADPRLLRVHINVDAVHSSGAFTLAYDSADDLSSLDTPVVTVPDWGLAFLLLVPLVPLLMSAIWRRRRLAGTIMSILLGAIVAISLLASQVVPTTAAPDVYYLHTNPTSGLTPAGEYMDIIEGSGGSTATFDAVGSTYWYADAAWPTGNDDASIAAGDYSTNLYFGSLPSGSNWYDANWLYRKQITVQSAEVDTNLTDFPVYVDLADLGSDFFSNVKADGGDIRVTTADGATELPREVVAIDAGAQTGELHFRADSLSSSSNTSFYIYYGNSGASDYAVTATYGRNNVWTNGYEAVWHLEEEASGTGNSGLYIDSTGNGYDGDDQVSATGQTGRIGAGQELDGSDDFIDMGDVLDFVDPAGFTLESWIRPTLPSGGSLEVSGTASHVTYDSVPDVTFQHTTPTGTNRLLLVGVSINNDELETVSSITYDGAALTKIGEQDSQDDARVEIWGRVAPNQGTNLNVVVTFSAQVRRGGVVGAVSFTGAEQVLPDSANFVGAFEQNGAGPAAVDVPSAAGELVFAVAAAENTTLTANGMTEHWNDNNASRDYGAAATEPGSTTTTMSWNLGSTDHWAAGGIPIKPAGGALSDQMTFISKWGGTGDDRNYRFEVETDNTVTFLPGGSVDPDLNSTTVMQSDTWYHAAINVRPNNDSIRLLLNGAQEDTSTSWTGAIADGTYSFNLGRRADAQQWFDGNLDEVRVSDVSRQTGWVETSYNNQNSTTSFYSVAAQEAHGSVEITVYVHHTKTDGSDPQLITSASTTIDADTADPLAFDLGNDPIGQTFTSADPRVLRLTVEVTAVNNGGSFVMDYDGACANDACSNLNTPVVVVPEFALVFGALAALIPVAMGGLWRRRQVALRARAAHLPQAKPGGRVSSQRARAAHLPPVRGAPTARAEGRRR